MEKFVEKLSSYDLLNNLLPGAIYFFLIDKFWNIKPLNNNWIENLFIYYFVGMVISRIGSLIIEPLYKKYKIVVYSESRDYYNATKKDTKIETLLCMSNLYRTMVGLVMSLVFSFAWVKLTERFEIIHYFDKGIILILLGVLFSFAYKKQVEYIVKRVENANKTK